MTKFRWIATTTLPALVLAAWAPYAAAGPYSDRGAGRIARQPASTDTTPTPVAISLGADSVREDAKINQFVSAVREASAPIADLVEEWNSLPPAADAVSAQGAGPKRPTGRVLTVQAARALLAVLPAPAFARSQARASGNEAQVNGVGPQNENSTLARALRLGAALLGENAPVPEDVRLWSGYALGVERGASIAGARTASALAQASASDASAAQLQRIVNLEDLKEKGIFVQRFFGPNDDELGAWLTFDRNLDSREESFSTQFCVGWQGSKVFELGGIRLKAVPAIAFSGQFLAEQKDRDNDWTAHGGLAYLIDFADGDDRGFVNRRSRRLQGNFVGYYTRSQDGQREEYGLDVELKPVWGDIWLNTRRGMETQSWPELVPGQGTGKRCYPVPDNIVSAQWLLSSSVQVGWSREENGGGTADSKSDFLDAQLTVGGRLYLDRMSRVLNDEAWDAARFPFIQGTWTGYFASNLGDETRHSWDVTGSFPIGHVWSIDASYHNGFSTHGDVESESVHIGLSILL